MMTFSTPLKFTATLGTALLLSACAENFEGVTSTSDPAPPGSIVGDTQAGAGIRDRVPRTP